MSLKKQDRVDRIRAQWAVARPEMDTSGFAVTGRVLLLGRLLERRVDRVLAPLGLSLWSFDVLATLRRQGPPFRLPAGALSRATMLTTGAMTNRINRLEQKGWLRREPDPDDRRGVLVTLTDAGRRLADRAVTARFAEAQDAMARVSATDAKTLERLLSRLLTEFEEPEVLDDPS
jgi:DNA-binding MarR family transcriptional regulator